jgi:hypothetical protein
MLVESPRENFNEEEKNEWGEVARGKLDEN